MADTIGSQSFLSLLPALPRSRRELEEMPRPNVNGRAYKYRQTKAPVVELIGQRDVANLSSADALKDTYVGMIGSLYQISQQGVTQPGYWVVLDADVTRITKLVIGVGGLVGGDVLIECRFAVTKAE